MVDKVQVLPEEFLAGAAGAKKASGKGRKKRKKEEESEDEADDGEADVDEGEVVRHALHLSARDRMLTVLRSRSRRTLANRKR